MLVLGLLAALVVGIGSMLAAAGVTRRNQTNTQPNNSPTVTDVAILIAAHDHEDRIVAALNSAARVVPVSNIHLVSDDATDRTATLARDYGAQVVETFGQQGPAGSVESGLAAFRLLDEYPFVLLADADTRLEPHHLERVLPLFADDSVAAVDVLVDTDRRPSTRHRPLAAVLTAYRARSYALAGRRGRVSTVPTTARTYRSSCLRELELNPADLAIADFDHTRQIYRRGLGRVVLCPDVTARTAAPTRLADFRAQRTQWYAGFWQSLRRNGLRPPRVAAGVAELLLSSLVLALAPLVALLAIPALRPPAPLSAWSIAVTIVAADYLLTVAVAIARRQPRLLLPGLLFPLLRVLDAMSVLAALVRDRSTPEWLTLAEPRPAPRERPAKPARVRNPLLAGVSWVLCLGAAAVVVARVVRTAVTLPPSVSETGLVDAAYGTRPAVGGALGVTDLQLRMYTTITSAFGRQPSVLQAARELSVVSAVVILLGLLAAAAILRVHPLVTALVLGALAVSGPAVALLTPVGAAVPAAAWLSIAVAAAVAAIGWRDLRWITGGAMALLIALLTLPALIIPIGAGLAALLATRSRLLAVIGLGVLALTAGLAAILWQTLLFPGESPLDARQRAVVLGVIGAAAAGGLIVRWLRPVGAGVGVGAVFVAAAGVKADALLPALLLGAALLAAVLVEEAAATQVGRGAAVAGAILAAVVGLAGAVAGALLGHRVWTPPDHAGLAGWAVQNLERDIRLIAPAGLRSDLDRDLSRAGRDRSTLPAGSPASQGELLVTTGQDGPQGIRLAGFEAISVLLPEPSDDGYLQPASRQAAGAQLAMNPRVRASDAVLAAFRAGRVDLRPMALLAAICRDHEITIAEAANPAHELGSPQPNRVLVLSEVDGQPVTDEARAGPLVAWLRAQEPPFAPADVSVTPAGVRVSWRLPARLDLPFS